MIGSIRGKVIYKDGLHIIVETGGVGYKVLVSEKIWSKASVGTELFLYIFTNVREDALDLLGFLEPGDLKLFENLITVSGVGPKTAMSIFSFSSREEIVGAVLRSDVEFFTAVPRLGRKNAQKIIIELKNKFGDKAGLDLSVDGGSQSTEVMAALKTFGFSQSEIIDALRNIDVKENTPEQKIKAALKYLGK